MSASARPTVPHPGPIPCPACGFIWTLEKAGVLFEGAQIQCRPRDGVGGCGRVYEIAPDGLKYLPDEEAW